MVYRIYVEKKTGLANEAAALKGDIKTLLGIDRIEDVRVVNRYDVENIDDALFADCRWKVFAEPQLDNTFDSLEELTALSRVCRKAGIPLYIDGARLAYGLASKETDVTLPDIARLCDVFYIGGTKCGALCGEAVVFTKGNKPEHYTALKKQRGALLAKGRLLGVQFDALFTDDLYFRIGEYAIEKAEELKAIFEKHRIEIYLPSPTNQQFIILSNERAEKLQDAVSVSFWEELNETHTIFRLATSWSTTEEDLKALDDALGAL